ncbi:MAG: cysteine desulfurase [Alicyclobacillus mali]|uniref:cysteine desulfurase family protein n=1 Tax=Alicyclobacillus mali (ex Roth et al. 2021) TaxID=1123961 RepID=UPI0023EF69D6|nr:cysteine desulfurase family protein [Alicyclobacillus mali (ex Roth et al. 2021)]MCL6487635.1 cysteine desulfurase [Alicyclobacillus mali (ex Roth et al. 2021)]
MIYLDNAATTPLLPAARAAMERYLGDAYGNPSSLHRLGRDARQAVEVARRFFADWLGVSPRDLAFTSGGTESNNLALYGAYLAQQPRRRHVVTTAVEHHAVLEAVDRLRLLGADVTLVPVDSEGRVHPDDVLRALRPDTAIVSVMFVNNEVGTVEPVAEIARLVKAADPAVVVHSDMVQALPVLRVALADIGVDLASFSAHKVHGPKGVGLLYVRSGTPFVALAAGGNQEHRLRAGTESVAGIAGFHAAMAEIASQWDAHRAHLAALRDALWSAVASLNGSYRNSPADAVPSILNVGFRGIRNDILLMRLDLEGVAASAGAACSAGSLEPSHVLRAMGREREARESIRLSFAWQNTMEEIDEAAGVLSKVVGSLRSRFTNS